MAGLFDSTEFDDPNEQQQGLIASMLASGLLPTQPGPGFPANPMDANASAAPAAPAPQSQSASPIGIGDYQMPRIGPAAAFTPVSEYSETAPPGENSPPAPGVNHFTPAPHGAPAPTPAAPAAAPSPLDTAGDHFKASWQSMRHGGGLIGGLSALVTGQRDDPQADALATQQTQLQKQFNAFRMAGATPQEAQIAVLNPEAAKAVVDKYVGKDKTKFVQLKDALGGDHPAFVNEDAQTINGQPIADYNKRNASDGGGALGDTSKTGAAYLATIPTQQRGIVQAMIEGRQPPPSSFALAKPYWQNMIAAAQNVDPTFDATNWGARAAGMKSFKSGADAGTVRSANQVLGHISDLTDRADDLHNGDHPAWNYVKNAWNSQNGEDAANNWTTQAHAVADELSAFMKGAGHSSDTEIQQWKESLSPNMSPQQQRGAIKTLMGIYDHALSALEDKRTGAIGQVAADKMGPLVTPSGQAAMDKVRKWAAGSAPGAANTTPTGVKWSVVQ